MDACIEKLLDKKMYVNGELDVTVWPMAGHLSKQMSGRHIPCSGLEKFSLEVFFAACRIRGVLEVAGFFLRWIVSPDKLWIVLLFESIV